MGVSIALHAVVLAGSGAGEPGKGQGGGESFTAIRLQLATPSEEPASPRSEVAQAPGPARNARPSRTRYYTSSEVDERATPLELVPLVYPEIAYLNRLPGTVRMRVFISEKGQVVRTQIVEATPPGHFEEAATDAVRRTRFRPAHKNGQPVRSLKVIEVGFDPYGPRPGDPGISPPS